MHHLSVRFPLQVQLLEGGLAVPYGIEVEVRLAARYLTKEGEVVRDPHLPEFREYLYSRFHQRLLDVTLGQQPTLARLTDHLFRYLHDTQDYPLLAVAVTAANSTHTRSY